MKIVAIIPARLASQRFPNKVVHLIQGLPMVEHVRRRALLSSFVDEVYVATCDKEVAEIIESFGGNVIMTSHDHENGTSRVSEAVRGIECTHVLLLQGDEPLLLPQHIDQFVNAMTQLPDVTAWNATGPISHVDELDRHSFVKCAVAEDDRIMYCFRRSPSHELVSQQQRYVRKMLGIIAYRKDFLLNLISSPASVVETIESIEQMRIIETGGAVFSVPVTPSLPSVNEPGEVEIVLAYLKQCEVQQKLLDSVLAMTPTSIDL